jgi:hypothetical protein
MMSALRSYILRGFDSFGGRICALFHGTAFDVSGVRQPRPQAQQRRKLMPDLWKRSEQPRTLFGDVVIVVFLAAQAVDGVLTYLGVVQFGTIIEANPVVAALMGIIGHGPALASVKVLAASLGIALHLGRVHRVLALLTVFYVIGSVVPWTALLYF